MDDRPWMIAVCAEVRKASMNVIRGRHPEERQIDYHVHIFKCKRLVTQVYAESRKTQGGIKPKIRPPCEDHKVSQLGNDCNYHNLNKHFDYFDYPSPREAAIAAALSTSKQSDPAFKVPCGAR
jgi:hypothetical protein